jgi:hypothetical protein
MSQAPPPPFPSDKPTEHPEAPGFFSRALAKRREKKASESSGRARYMALLERLPQEGPALIPELRAASDAAGLSGHDLRKITASTFRTFAESVLADNILNEKEEAELLNVANALGIEQADLQTDFGDILNELVVARVNDGRLPTVASPSLMTTEGEVVHMQESASLMKEVAIREYRGGYSGFSFRVMKGVRFHTGGVRGHSVVVGTEMQVADAGTLVVSSRRIVFLGSKSTMEIAYKKLLNMDVFTDGVRFHISNRKTAPLFKLASGTVVAAIVNAAFQRFD